MKYRYYIKTLGCKVNQYDSGVLVSSLLSLGFEESQDKPDLVIINSCAVTQSAISKSRYFVNYYKKQYPKAKIVLFGCWPQTHDLKIKGVDLISGTGQRQELLTKLLKLFSLKVDKNKVRENLSHTDRHRYFLKVQDGCNQFCSYCIIPYSRGRLKSRKQREIIEEAGLAIKRGYNEIIITGIHVGLYGVDLKNKSNLESLLEVLLQKYSQTRFRLSSIEVSEVTTGIINLMKKYNNFCPHLHISLQSGSDKILKLMNRPYSVKDFKNQVLQIRKQVPDVSISTDVIVGFPSESEKNFKDSYNFCKEIEFSKIHVFSFSLHKKTQAYNLPSRVKVEDIKIRSKKLRGLGRELESKYMDKISKRDDLEMVSESTKGNYIFGHSQYFTPLKIKKPNNFLDKDLGKRIKV
ncbi:MAG: tRNA (N(6)-L-threonylcarbamoyladenosine(37)-C(2))-methylthiotransferase MtaB [Candidatus Pacebacteria bacterium]|nr:tRNA (N(6)-L-threonylcarbamoyladenosine(37)-C(2))-methylthiotransferase MtaB [Candidatus Paceibacterota bacterium]